MSAALQLPVVWGASSAQAGWLDVTKKKQPGRVEPQERAVKLKQLGLPQPAALGIFSGMGDAARPGDSIAMGNTVLVLRRARGYVPLAISLVRMSTNGW